MFNNLSFCLFSLITLPIASINFPGKLIHSNFDEQLKIKKATASSLHRTLLYDTNERTESKVSITPQIVGGTVAPVASYTPYIVAIFREQNGQLSPICSGIQLSFDVVLTAAHCSTNANVIFSGMHDLRWNAYVNRKLNIKKYRISDVLVHPSYNVDAGFNNDLCLLKLSIDTSFPLYINHPDIGSEFNPFIQINDASTIPSPKHDILNVAGWGATEYSSYSLQMRHTTVSPISNDECNKMYNSSSKITSNMICCTSPPNDPGNDSCYGDSGGPLVIPGGADNGVDDLLVGIVSWGYDCADPDYPGVYSRLSDNSDWIEEKVCEMSDFSVCENGKLRRRSIGVPTRAPTAQNPTDIPISPRPSENPTEKPTTKPSRSLKQSPTNTPISTKLPTSSPEHSPTPLPTNTQVESPTNQPTLLPTEPVYLPTYGPTNAPTNNPTHLPTYSPSNYPTHKPTEVPIPDPTEVPTETPTKAPTHNPSIIPTTRRPTQYPTPRPTNASSRNPTKFPSRDPSKLPTHKPNEGKKSKKTRAPTRAKTPKPTNTPTPKVRIGKMYASSTKSGSKKWKPRITFTIVDTSTNKPVESVSIRINIDQRGKVIKKKCRSKINGKCKFKLGKVLVLNSIDSLNISFSDVSGPIGYDGTNNVLHDNNGDGYNCNLFSKECPSFLLLSPYR